MAYYRTTVRHDKVAGQQSTVEDGKLYLIFVLMLLDKLIETMVGLDIASLLEHNFIKVLYDVGEGRHSVFSIYGNTNTTQINTTVHF